MPSPPVGKRAAQWLGEHADRACSISGWNWKEALALEPFQLAQPHTRVKHRHAEHVRRTRGIRSAWAQTTSTHRRLDGATH